MRYSRNVLAAISDCTDTLRGASTIVQTKMAIDEDAKACADRQFQIDCISRDLTFAYVGVMSELMQLGSSVDCIPVEDLPDIQTTIRQMFEEAAYKAWRNTRTDAQQFHLEAAE